MRIGSLDNYRLILNYSLVSPGRSNLQNIGLANKEFNMTPVTKGYSTSTSAEGEQKEFKWEPYVKNSDDTIKKIEAKILNMAGAYIDLYTYEKNLSNKERQLAESFIDVLV
jgi:hypothetical protein